MMFVSADLTAADVDILIENARIVDGTGNPWFRGEVAIAHGRIFSIGPRLEVVAQERIDAADRVLAPGFIDVHVHAETDSPLARGSDGIERQPLAANFLRNGVTTIITGNCGYSVVNIAAWRSRLQNLGINIGTLIGHNVVRLSVMGRADRAPTPQEMTQMEWFVDRAMRDGALGLSTGLAYAPGTFASSEEIIRLAKGAARHGGVYATHLRNQGARLQESIEESARIGKAAGLPVHIAHLKVKGRKRWGTIDEVIEQIKSYRIRGLDMTLDVYPYDRASTKLNILLPAWARAGDAPDILARVTNTVTRSRIAAEMKRILKEDGYPDYSYAVVSDFPNDSSLEGKSIRDLAATQGNGGGVDDQIEIILDLAAMSARAGDPDGPAMVYHFMSMQDVETILQYDHALLASDGAVFEFGDGMPHPRAYGANARLISYFVRERQTLTLEDAVRRMTSLPARRFNLDSRGVIAPGFAADLVIFDPEEVNDKSTFSEPHAYSEGFEFVFVNGKAVVKNGELTDTRPGQFVSSSRSEEGAK